MKKIIVVIMVFALGLTSCIKEYTCDCRDAAGNNIGGGMYKTVSKSRALEKCKKTAKAASTGATDCSIE